MNVKNKIFSILLCLALMLTYVPFAVFAADSALSDDIAVLYTNDVHTYIDGALSYDVIAAVKEELQKEYKYVILADAGDHIQGTAYGSMDKGESIIKMMNAAGYDVATLGNHEFDYTMQGCMDAIDWAEYPYTSCNFHRVENGVRGENVLDSYVMFDCGDEKIAFVGITTPETFSKSTPAYFQDENGNFIYGITSGDDGSKLRQDLQTAIDEAEDAGATKVIALGHLGVDPSSTPWTSEETIAGVSGLDAFIDGHSHTVMESKEVKDKDGESVLLTQTGEYFNRIGMMVIDSESGEITTDFIECVGSEEEGYSLSSELYSGTEVISDAEVKEIKDGWISEIDEMLGKKIGTAVVTLDNYDSEGNRLVRVQETNSGDFAADALYYLFDGMDLDVDFAVMNGGGTRNKAITGDITYKTCKDMHPFGNVACLQTVTGQQMLDMLEWGARYVGESESGSFLHVSGLTYKIDTSIENTTKTDETEAWIGGPEEYRVYDVKVYNKDTGNWDDLDLNAEYNLAGYNYNLRDLGDGFGMMDGAVNVVDYVMEDYMVLANYIQGFEGGVVDAANSPLLEKYPGLLIDYSDINGSGRIEVVDGAEAAPEASQIYVGDIKVTEENADDVLGDADGEGATVFYDAETNTLTLKDADITGGTEYVTNSIGALCSIGDLNIVLEGKNTVTAPDHLGYSTGIFVWGDVNITGSGSLTVSGGTVAGDGGDMTLFYSCGIFINGHLTISGAEVTAFGGKIDVTCNTAGGDENIETLVHSEGVFVNNGVTLENGAVLTAVGDEVNLTSNTSNYVLGAGIIVYNGALTVNDSYLKGVGGRTVANMDTSTSYGIVVYGSDMIVDGSSSKVIAASDASESPDITGSNGICVSAGNLIIKAGEVTVSANKRTETEEGDAHAICVYSEPDENGVTVGGNMYVECDSVEFSPESGFIGTTLTVNAPYGDAIYVSEGLYIDDTLTVSAPAEGVIQQIGEDDVRYTIVDADGNAAQNVTVKPLIYNVFIEGLDDETVVEVPAGKSVNEVYCDTYGVSDFSEVLNPEKEGYTFGGWYTDEACTDGNEYSFDTVVNGDVTVYPKWVEGSIPSTSPQTGDGSVWMTAVMFVSGCAVIGVVLTEKKRRMASK